MSANAPLNHLAEYLWEHWSAELSTRGRREKDVSAAVYAYSCEVMEWANDQRTWESLCGLLARKLK